MQEPAGPVTVSLIVVFSAWMGPVVGPYALIAFAASAGGLLALTRRDACTRVQGVLYMGTTVLLALLVVGPLAWALEHYASVPAHIALAPIAAGLGVYRDQMLAAAGTWLTGLPTALAGLNPFAGRGRSGP